jgi:hypothetical protein
MEYTNKLDLPSSLVETLKKHDSDYIATKSDEKFSATGLLNPPHQTKLLKFHGGKLTEDVSDRIWLLLGSAIHGILEAGETSEQLIEERFFATVDGIKISGMIDVYSNGKISDWKVTSVYTLDNVERLRKFEEQLNILAYLMRVNNFEVDKLEIVAILRDWGRRHAVKHPAQVETLNINLWSLEEQETFIKERLALHLADDNEFCSMTDRWNKGDKFAVMKKGRKSAIRLHDTEAEAIARMEAEQEAKPKDKFYLEVRKGENVRCLSYCPVAKFCEFGKSLI